MSIKIAGLKLYDLKKLSKVLKVSIITLRGYIEQGRLKAVKIGRSYRITEQFLQDFLLKKVANPLANLSLKEDPILKVIGISSDGSLSKNIDQTLYGKE